MSMHPLVIIERDLEISRLRTDRPRRPMPGEQQEPRPSIVRRLLCRTHKDESIRHTMPWLVASGAITPAIYGRRK